jgi:hypothetical protein
MNLPELQGTLDQPDFFIYVASDSDYFDRFGVTLINSVTRNTNFGVHVHLYNPRTDQLEFCDRTRRVSFTWEQCPAEQFASAIKFWSRPNLPEPYLARKKKMLGMKQADDPANLITWIYKTYYACMRFCRLPEIVKTPRRFLEIDIDGIVRRPFDSKFANDDDYDFFLYEKPKGGHLAGAILYTGTQQSLNFTRDLANTIRDEIRKDNIYWFLDQHSIDSVIMKYRYGILPITYVDWHMQPDSAIWSAKGKRKDLEIFKQEQAKYQ